ncbi:hypothetical protein MPSI1_001620 [Malassezia psittaci]|uniref:Uncharacterized protein n=1 Tax=Malassezia psittaci TaxID=1821823 RepID=A0AAF0F9T5_9BASI|nr:hypothetical protein MPSI1_001620 [Malassezia psittaci]
MQLKQVRERIAKGLAEKGVLRTEKKSFLLFDMPTHPLADRAQKEAVLRRIYALLTSKSQSVHPDEFYKEEPSSVRMRVTRTLCMVCCAFCANVLENTLTHLPTHLSAEVFDRASALVTTYGQWPMAPDTPGGGIPGNGEFRPTTNSSSTSIRLFSKTKKTVKIGVGDAELVKILRTEMQESHSEPAFEVIAGVLHVFVCMHALE